MQKNSPSAQRTRDQLFATGLLTLLRQKANHLPTSVRATLLAIAENPSNLDSTDAKYAVKSLFSLHPSFMRDVTPDNMVMHSMLPIFIWAAEENGQPDCGLAKTVSNWGNDIVRDSDCALENSLRSLNIINALRDELTEPDLIALANQWQNKKTKIIGKHIYTLSPEPMITWTEAMIQLGLLYDYLAKKGIKDTSKPGLPAWGVRWVQGLRISLSDMARSQQEVCVLQWTQSSLSRVLKLRACKQVSPHVWLSKTCLDALEPLLPKNENERWPMLPWRQVVKKSESTEQSDLALIATFNQTMHRTYCPESANILDVLTTHEQWTNRSYIEQCMAGFAKRAPRLEVLTDLDNVFDL